MAISGKTSLIGLAAERYHHTQREGPGSASDPIAIRGAIVLRDNGSKCSRSVSECVKLAPAKWALNQPLNRRALRIAGAQAAEDGG